MCPRFAIRKGVKVLSRLDIMTPSRAQTVIDGLYRDVERRIAASPPGLCPVDLAMNFLNLCHAQTCGKCVPCRVGLGQLSDLMESVLDGKATMETIALIERTARTIYLSADCAIGYEAGDMALTAIRGFRDDFEHHVQKHACGFTQSQLVPCVSGCPVQVKIPEFIKKITEKDYEGAYQVIHETSSLPAVCGRVCPQETQCESKCIRGIKGEPVGIGRLERFVADWHNANVQEAPAKPAPNGHKVAVIGSGPSGLTCAGDLAKKGYDVTVFEALHLAGGVLVYGIPEFRLPKAIVQKEVDGLKALGVKVETNMVIGRVVSIDELMSEYGFEAVFIGSGAGLPMFMHIPGENLCGVYSANEFLTRINLMKAYKDGSDTPIMPLQGKKVAVVGGGNVAMDAARCSKRLGADVYVVYRRGMEELPARHEEVEHAIEEGIVFKTLNNPVKINGDEKGYVSSMTCVEMELGEPDASGRRRPIEKVGSEHDLPVDCVIMSLGTTPNPLIKNTTPGLEVNRKGGIVVNEAGLTSHQNVYAGGDAVTGAATVILAMGAGKLGAKSIDEALSK